MGVSAVRPGKQASGECRFRVMVSACWRWWWWWCMRVEWRGVYVGGWPTPPAGLAMRSQPGAANALSAPRRHRCSPPSTAAMPLTAACLPACKPARLPACPPACSPAHLPARLTRSDCPHLCCSSSWRLMRVWQTRRMSRTRMGERHSSLKKVVGFWAGVGTAGGAGAAGAAGGHAREGVAGETRDGLPGAGGAGQSRRAGVCACARGCPCACVRSEGFRAGFGRPWRGPLPAPAPTPAPQRCNSSPGGPALSPPPPALRR